MRREFGENNEPTLVMNINKDALRKVAASAPSMTEYPEEVIVETPGSREAGTLHPRKGKNELNWFAKFRGQEPQDGEIFARRWVESSKGGLESRNGEIFARVGSSEGGLDRLRATLAQLMLDYEVTSLALRIKLLGETVDLRVFDDSEMEHGGYRGPAPSRTVALMSGWAHVWG